MKRRPAEHDLDAIHQRIADLEALLMTPGWAILCTEATRLYGTKIFVETMALAARGRSAQELGEKAHAIIAAREAVNEVLDLPSAHLVAAKKTLALLTQTARRKNGTPLGPAVEMS